MPVITGSFTLLPAPRSHWQRASTHIFISYAEVDGRDGVGCGRDDACTLRFEPTPTRGRVHIPMSTEAAETRPHAHTPPPQRAQAPSNDRRVLTFSLLASRQHMEHTDEYNQGNQSEGLLKKKQKKNINSVGEFMRSGCKCG